MKLQTPNCPQCGAAVKFSVERVPTHYPIAITDDGWDYTGERADSFDEVAETVGGRGWMTLGHRLESGDFHEWRTRYKDHRGDLNPHDFTIVWGNAYGEDFVDHVSGRNWEQAFKRDVLDEKGYPLDDVTIYAIFEGHHDDVRDAEDDANG